MELTSRPPPGLPPSVSADALAASSPPLFMLKSSTLNVPDFESMNESCIFFASSSELRLRDGSGAMESSSSLSPQVIAPGKIMVLRNKCAACRVEERALGRALGRQSVARRPIAPKRYKAVSLSRKGSLRLAAHQGQQSGVRQEGVSARDGARQVCVGRSMAAHSCRRARTRASWRPRYRPPLVEPPCVIPIIAHAQSLLAPKIVERARALAQQFLAPIVKILRAAKSEAEINELLLFDCTHFARGHDN